MGGGPKSIAKIDGGIAGLHPGYIGHWVNYKAFGLARTRVGLNVLSVSGLTIIACGLTYIKL